jgi:hypothetical protein
MGSYFSASNPFLAFIKDGEHHAEVGAMLIGQTKDSDVIFDEWFVAGGDVTVGYRCLAIDLSVCAMAIWTKRASQTSVRLESFPASLSHWRKART